MSTYKLNITLPTQDFPELGTPLRMKAFNDVKASIHDTKRTDKDDYNLVRDNIHTQDLSYTVGVALGGTDNDQMMGLDLDYEKGIPKTYKFLGMDINDEFQAIIPVGDGYVVVGEMFNQENLKKFKSGRSMSDYETTLLEDILNNSSEEMCRTLVTAIKFGDLYDVAADNNDISNNLINILIGVLRNYFESIWGDTGNSKLPYKSILLNLVHTEGVKKKELSNNSNKEESIKEVYTNLLGRIFKVWREVLEKYNKIYSVLSSIDMWETMYRRMIGDNNFNPRLKNCISLYRSDTGEQLDGIVSLSGIAKNMSISEGNTDRLSCVNQIHNLIVSTKLGYDSTFMTYSRGGDRVQDFMSSMQLGCIDTSMFSNPYELTPGELQALSIYDGLSQIDEDASMCVDSYDMENPDERALFIKSAMKSYETNFREYKPKKSYEITEALSDLVERGLSFKSIEVSMEDNTDNEDPLSGGNEVSLSKEGLEVILDRRTLLKVSKLLKKTLGSINELF